jgi:intracellular protein transport protein USO1
MFALPLIPPGLQLVEPIKQSSEVDSIVPALCTFLLGICYEFDTEPGKITR